MAWSRQGHHTLTSDLRSDLGWWLYLAPCCPPALRPNPNPTPRSPKADPCPVERVMGTQGASALPAKPCGSEAAGLVSGDHAPVSLVAVRVPRCHWAKSDRHLQTSA